MTNLEAQTRLILSVCVTCTESEGDASNSDAERASPERDAAGTEEDAERAAATEIEHLKPQCCITLHPSSPPETQAASL